MFISVVKIIRDNKKCPNKLQIDWEKKLTFYNATLEKTQCELFDVFNNDSVSHRGSVVRSKMTCGSI